MRLENFLERMLAVLILAVFALVVVGGSASAGPDYPFANGVFTQDDVECPEGYVCLTQEEWDDLVICPYDPTFEHPTPTVTSEPTSTPTGPTPTPTEPTEERQACNRGIGNLEEGCDPGNSFGQGQGEGRPAGEDRFEDQGPPGNQNHGNQGNQGQGGNPNN